MSSTEAATPAPAAEGGGTATTGDDKDVPASEFETFSKGGGMQANVDELIAKFREKIDRLRERVREIVPQDDPQYDDIFYLRYVLSYKAKTTKCVEPIRWTVDFRTTHAELLAKIRAEGVDAVPHHKVAMRFNCTGTCGHLPSGEPMWVVRTGHCMQSQLMNTLSKQEVLDWLLFSKEIQFQECDRKTRETRRLCKTISIIDFDGFSMGQGDRRFFKVLGESSKMSAKCYPQLLGKSVMINTPSFFRWMMKVFSVFQPKSAVEKMVVCGAKNSSEESGSKCPFLTRMNAFDRVPNFLGGTGPIPPELEPFNTRANFLTPLDIPPRKAAEPVEMEVPKDSTVTWEIVVEARKVHVWFDYCTADNKQPQRLQVPEAGEDGMVRVQSTNGLTTGSFKMPVDGTVLVTFDNTHSLLRGKHVEYRMDIIPPEELADGDEASGGGGGGGGGGEKEAPALPAPEGSSS